MSIPPLQIPAGLAAAYGVSQGEFRFITQVQNYIFAYERNGEEFILRLTPQTHQSAEQVRAEVDWVNDLAGRGVPVAGAVPASDGSLCQAVELVGEHFTAVTFKKVRGEIGNGNYWTADIFFEWGRLTGRLHRESRKYQPGSGPHRASWGDQLPSVIPESVDDGIAMEQLAKVAECVNSLPKSSDSYGLIHADLHFWNFGVSPTGLTVFDFDKVREICIYLVLRKRWKNRKLSEFQRRFFESVRQGMVEDRAFYGGRS